MEAFIEAVEQSVAAGNWYAALAVALTIPDICGRLQSPEAGSQARFVQWWERYVQPSYTFPAFFGQPKKVFLEASDAYSLRCAYLHEGRDDIAEQRARVALTKFRFAEPPGNGNRMHCNLVDGALQLQIDVFCTDVAHGARQWLQEFGKEEYVQANLAGLVRINAGLMKI